MSMECIFQTMRFDSGNVLFIILVAIGLFSALAYAVTHSNRRSENVGNESARAAATEILNNANLLRNTVMRLELSNGCEVREINFQNTTDTGYTAIYPRANRSCDVFGPAGGKLSWIRANPNWFIPQSEAASGAYASYESGGYGRFYFSNAVCITNVGTGDCPTGGAGNELIVGLLFLKKEICQAINDIDSTSMLSSTASPMGKPDGGNRYRGNFHPSILYTNPSGRMMGCINATKTGYTFYYVLKAR